MDDNLSRLKRLLRLFVQAVLVFFVMALCYLRIISPQPTSLLQIVLYAFAGAVGLLPMLAWQVWKRPIDKEV